MASNPPNTAKDIESSCSVAANIENPPISTDNPVEHIEVICVVEEQQHGEVSPEILVELLILDIEGREHRWHKDTVTPEEIAHLGGWDACHGVIAVDKDNNECTLKPGEPIKIHPHHRFGKKHKWKRGLMRERILQELDLLRRYFLGIQHIEVGGEDWFLIPDHPLPSGWQIGVKPIEMANITFKIVAAYPTSEPYGFLLPAGINFKGTAPGNTGAPPAPPPFPGAWHHFSWAPEGWTPSSDLLKGQNLLTWIRSFTKRLQEGA